MAVAYFITPAFGGYVIKKYRLQHNDEENIIFSTFNDISFDVTNTYNDLQDVECGLQQPFGRSEPDKRDTKIACATHKKYRTVILETSNLTYHYHRPSDQLVNKHKPTKQPSRYFQLHTLGQE